MCGVVIAPYTCAAVLLSHVQHAPPFASTSGKKGSTWAVWAVVAVNAARLGECCVAFLCERLQEERVQGLHGR